MYVHPNRVYCLIFSDLIKGFEDLGVNFMKTLGMSWMQGLLTSETAGQMQTG